MSSGEADCYARAPHATLEGAGMNAEIKQCDPIRLVAVHHVGPYQEIGKAFERIAHFGHARQLFYPGLKVVGIYYDDPENPPAHGLRADAGFSVQSDPGNLEDGMHMVDVPGGEYACVLHEGPYTDLPSVYGAAMKAIGDAGRQMDCDRPCYEIYLNSPQDTAPEDLKTQVHVPVA